MFIVFFRFYLPACLFPPTHLFRSVEYVLQGGIRDKILKCDEKCDKRNDGNTDGTLDIGDYVNSILDIAPKYSCAQMR